MRPIFNFPELDVELREFGYVTAPLMSRADCRALAGAYESLATVPPDAFHSSIYTNDVEYRRRVNRLLAPVFAPRIERLLYDYRICLTNFMVKEPGPDSAMRLHQDWSFVDEARFVAVHIWCPLVDVNLENGCLAVVPGSHRLSDHYRAFDDTLPFRDVLPLVREKYLREVEVSAGEAICYDGRTMHGSRINSTPHRRVVAHCIAVPREAEIWHWYRVSPTQLEVYPVDEDFLIQYELHKPPRVGTPVRRIDYVVEQLTPEQLAAPGGLIPADGPQPRKLPIELGLAEGLDLPEEFLSSSGGAQPG